jgi:hypothetical protein
MPLYQKKGIRPFTSVLTINKKHFDKVFLMYTEWLKNNNLETESSTHHNFLSLLYCLLARYETYSAGATGFQGALPHNVFDALKDIFKVDTECFASPLNCHFTNYYSAFADTDNWFGSKGTFFKDFKPLTGAFAVNPPFVNEVMLETSLNLNKLLDQPDADLFFFIIMPAWTDSASFETLSKSPYMRHTFQLMRDRHKYIDGMQHRFDKLWVANVESSCFLLSNKEIPKEKVEQLKLAFKAS